MTTKSKGKTTYHAARAVGSPRPSLAFSPASTEDEITKLTNYIKDWNRGCVKHDDIPLELVRVEVTPV